MRLTFIVLLALCVVTNYTWAQSRKLTGTVLDEAGEPVAGVNVMPDDGTAATRTNEKGEFSLVISEKTMQVQFSSISYMSQTVPVTNDTHLDIILKQDVIGLEEAIVVGYGTQKKANLTGAVASVEVDEVEGRALTSVDQLLQGKAAGVGIVQNSGRPGDDMSEIRIRGVSSIDNNNEPLVIVDGVQANLNDVSPNDIASVSVLKDAASAAIYGSRASAGVIVIETKRGAADGDGLKLDYNGTLSVSNATRLPETVDSYTYARLINEARQNVGQPPVYSDAVVELYRNQTDSRYPSTDWYDTYFKQGQMQNHYIALRGGNKNYRFSNSVAYKDQQGVLIGTGANRISFNSNLSGSFFNNKLRLGLGAVGYRERVDELTSATNSVMSEIAGMSPAAFIRSIDTLTGNENLYGYNARFLAARELGGGINSMANNLNTRASVELEPVKNLVGKLLLSNNKYGDEYVNFSPEFYTAGDFLESSTNKRQSSLEKRFLKRDQNTFLLSLDYGLTAGKHDMQFFAAHEKLETIYKRDDGSVLELSSNAPIFNYGDPNTLYLNSLAYEFATSSYFGRFNYVFADKYLLEVNFRRDGSSRFSKANRWGNFPSVSAGWRISEEPFLKQWDFLNLKLRASWGRLGNQNIWSQYAFADQMSGQEYYAFGNVIVPGRGTTLLANQATRWETTEQTNVGLDLVLWNRFNLEADFFTKKTFDILARVTIPPSLGVSSLPYQNVGTMINKGIEINLGYRSTPHKDRLNYAIAANLTYLTNELTDLGGLPFIDHTANIRSVVGHPFSSFYGYRMEGVYQVSDFTWQENSDPSIPHTERTYVLKDGYPDQSSLMDSPAPGDIKLADTDGNGAVTPGDRVLIGNPLPKWQYGFSADLSYKQFSLNIIGHGVSGADAYMNGKLIAPFFNTNGPIRTEMVDKRWTFENPSDRYQRIYVDKTRDALVTSYNIYNASFFRLKSVQLGYELPIAFVQRYKVNRCRVFVNAENLLLVTPFVEGFDPERSYNSVTAAFHPQIASFSFGFNLNF
ncbi:SusC/RagA family TonB-linked outer membrane protein [Parapedobacter tibetensis]|uniref:SusC/RagA family TonB-linked outer membrane protein n=1 Tax=Parapedobacter tibetensis TaxID=2972951 RepID=UPI00214DF0DF|nr:TonB-dependent receptor [Parapedobacter tibetensis]